MTEPRVLMPKRQVLADDVYDALKDSILSGRLPASSKINLEEIRRETGVSNTPIRQALSRLEAEGLVVKEAYRGFAVAEPPDAARLDEIFEVRLILEPAAASLAAQRRTAEQLESLREYTERALRNPQEEFMLDGTFHQILVEAAHNTELTDAIERTGGRRLAYNIYGAGDNAEQTWAEHATILEALEAGDTKGAALAMRRHIELSLKRHRRFLHRDEHVD